MNKTAISLALVAALGGSLAIAKEGETDTSKSSLKSGDKSFVEKAAAAGNAEIAASKLALTKSGNADIKSFAQMMVQDHGAAADKLKTIATGKGVTVSEVDTGKYKSDLDKLGKLSGADFDKAYASNVGVSAHKDAVSLFEKESKSGSDADLKSFAGATLPKLQQHLDNAKALDRKIRS